MEGITMNTEITWKNLSRAGFQRVDINKWKKDNVTIEVNNGSISERPFICYVYTTNMRYVKALAPVETIEHLNQFMALMNIDFKLKVE